ncbi:MAG TPA: carboxylate-amine ligase [Pyrinomonadaceae bacterium]|nr:carboxylate-amine ligase [Pyrinomonadaceae bacterium]
MMRTASSMFEQFTLGIEEEFQLVDPNTRELRSHVSEILDEGKMLLGEQVKPEMIQSMIEVGTGVCADVQEARADVIRLRGVISNLVRKQGLMIVAAGTHPFSHWQEQKIYENARYESIVEENQIIARSLLTFGLHVHVGISNPERAIQIMNAIRYLLPHVLALSTSSPFWLGVNTGLKSYRSEVFARFPRTGIPDYFESRSSFERYVELLVKTGCIDDGKKIYWDVRPHPFFPTLEFRICDIPTRVDDTIAIAALFQAMVAKVNKLLDQNLTFRLHHKMLIEENKWRAVRHGLDGKMIDFGKGAEVPVRELIRELLEFVDDVIDDLRSRKEIRHIRTILNRGTSADEQLRVWHETQDIHAVVDRLIELTMENVPHEIPPARLAEATASGS